MLSITHPLLLAAAVTTGSAHPASINTIANQPIDLVACSVNASQNFSIASESVLSNYAIPGSVTISFVNRAPAAATNVDFAVQDGDQTIALRDAGSFASGVRVTHTFTPETLGLDASAPVSCGVNAVTYGDGNGWSH